ncbi:hypothetical protein Plhal304r1_c086g0169341 [Plasmopara halstedii]
MCCSNVPLVLRLVGIAWEKMRRTRICTVSMCHYEDKRPLEMSSASPFYIDVVADEANVRTSSNRRL